MISGFALGVRNLLARVQLNDDTKNNSGTTRPCMRTSKVLERCMRAPVKKPRRSCGTLWKLRC